VWKILPPLGFDPQTVQPVASRYTDWAIPDIPFRERRPKILVSGPPDWWLCSMQATLRCEAHCSVQDTNSSQWHFWKFKSYGMWCCDVEVYSSQTYWRFIVPLSSGSHSPKWVVWTAWNCIWRHYEPSEWREQLAQWQGTTSWRTWIFRQQLFKKELMDGQHGEPAWTITVPMRGVSSYSDPPRSGRVKECLAEPGDGISITFWAACFHLYNSFAPMNKDNILFILTS